MLFRAGDVAAGCYRLEQGLLKLSIASPQGDERILTILGPGSIVGELAIIDGLPRSATVVAIRDCKLSFISREAFLGCLREYPEVYSDLVSTLVSRLREADDADDGGYLFCGHPKMVKNLPYCSAHCALCYRADPLREN